MKYDNQKLIFALAFTFVAAFLVTNTASAQIQAAGGGWYRAGYGTVYGSFGQANASENLQKTVQTQMQRATQRDAMIKKWGLAAVEKAEREAAAGSSGSAKSSNPAIVAFPPPVVRNYGVFRPDPTVDIGKALADALGDTAAEKTLIKQIYSATKAAYEKEVAARGWKNNIAGGLTFFTVTAMTVYHDAPEPSDAAVNAYFRIVNAALDETPAFATIANKDKQAFNNMLIGFSGLLLAGYTDGKQNNDEATLATYKKLAFLFFIFLIKIFQIFFSGASLFFWS